MGKAKTQRTVDVEAVYQAVRLYTLAKQAEEAIEQHNFDKLVAQGVIVKEAKQLLIEGDKYQAYRRLLMIEELGGGFEKGVTPQDGRRCCNHRVPR